MNKISNLIRKMIESGMILVISNFINQGIVFLSAPLFSRMMSTSDFGFFSSFVSLTTIIQIIMTLNIHSSIYNAKIEYDKESLKKYLKHIICFIAIFGSIFSILLLLLSNIIMKIFQLNFKAIVIACIYTLLYCLYMTFNTYLIANKDDSKSIVLASILTFVYSACNVLFSIMFVLNMEEEKYFGRCYGMIAGVIIAILVALPYCRKIFKNVSLEFSTLKKDILFGLEISVPLIFHSLSAIILSKMDQLMLLNLISPSKAGIYAYGNNFSHVFSTICQSFNTVYLPWYMTHKKNNEEIVIVNKSNAYRKFIFVIFSCFNLIIPEIVYLLSDSTYYSAIYSIQIIVIGMYFNYLYYFIVNFETYYKKTKYIAIGTVLSGISNIILNLLLIPKFEDIGAAFATMMSLILLFVFHAVIVKLFIKEYFEIGIKKLVISGMFAIILGLFCITIREYVIIRFSLVIFIVSFFIYEYIFKFKKGRI